MGSLVNLRDESFTVMDSETRKFFEIHFRDIETRIEKKLDTLDTRLTEEANSRRKHQQRYSEELRQLTIEYFLLKQSIQQMISSSKNHIIEDHKIHEEVLANSNFRKTTKVILVGIWAAILALISAKWW